MRCITGGGPVRINSLLQLDELVAKHVTGKRPLTSWEDSNALFRFDTEDEARAAIHDAYYQMFCPETDWTKTEVTRLEIYPAYSSSLEEAWKIVECLNNTGHSMQMRREDSEWVATFGKFPAAAGSTVPIALCMAGLRTRGIEAMLDLETSR